MKKGILKAVERQGQLFKNFKEANKFGQKTSDYQTNIQYQNVHLWL